MTSFREHIAAYGQQGPELDRAELNDIIRQHRWFTTAQILTPGPATDTLLAMHSLSHGKTEDKPMEGADTIIDTFLEKGEHKIVPDERTSDFDAAEQSNRLELSEDMISEELAAIYRSQGLAREADEIMKRLGQSEK